MHAQSKVGVHVKKLMVTTGNGMFGRALVDSLAGRDDVEVKAMVRNLDAFDVHADNVTAVRGDMDDPASLAAAVEGVTDVFLVSPMDEHIATREINVIDAVVATGADVRILKLHGAVEHRGDHLSQLHAASIAHLKESGLRWTLICPNSVMETSFLGLNKAIQFGMIAGTSGHGKVGFVALENVADATAQVVVDGGCVGESVMLTGPAAVDMYQVAADFSKVLGKEIPYNDMTEDDFANMVIEFGAFPDRETCEMQVLCHYRAWRRGDAALVSEDFERVTGRKAESVLQWIEKHKEHFAG